MKDKIILTAHLMSGATKRSFEMWDSFNVDYEAKDNEIVIYAPIVDAGMASMYKWMEVPYMTAQMFKSKMDAIVGDVMLKINCDGGDVFEASAMVQCIRERQKAGFQVNSSIDGIAASAATLLTSASDEITIAEMGMMMIHKGSAMMYGNAKELHKAADNITMIDESAMKLYEKKTGIAMKDLSEMMDEETYMNADMAVEKGFADSVYEADDSDISMKLDKSFVKMKSDSLSAIFASL